MLAVHGACSGKLQSVIEAGVDVSLHPLSLEPLRARLYSLLVGGMEREPARGGGLFADVRDAANREPVSVMDTGRVLSACRGSWRRCRRRRSVARRRRQDRHAGADDCARRWEPRRREGEGGDEGGQHHVYTPKLRLLWPGEQARSDIIKKKKWRGRAAISRREPTTRPGGPGRRGLGYLYL